MASSVLSAVTQSKPGDTGPAVANYQRVLTLLEPRAKLPGQEIIEQRFGDGTQSLSRQLLTQLGVSGSGDGSVSPDTATQINAFLVGRGILASVSGKVSGTEPVNGLIVRVFDQQNLEGNAAATAATGPDGTYRIFYDPNFYKEADQGVVQPVARVVVVLEAVDSTGRIARSAPTDNPGQLVLDLSSWAPAPAKGPPVVRGTVVDADGDVIDGITIKLVNRGIAGSSGTELGTTTTTLDGSFSIFYRVPGNDGPAAGLTFKLGLGTIDLVLDRVTREQARAVEPIIGDTVLTGPSLSIGIAARLDEHVRLTAKGVRRANKPTEFDALDNAVRPLLGTHSPADLDESAGDPTFIARSLNRDPQLIQDFVTAHRLQRDIFSAVDVPSIFALVRTGLRDADSITAMPPDVLAERLLAAEGKVIAAKSAGTARNDRLAVAAALSRVTSQPNFGTIDAVLALDLPDANQRRALTTSLVNSPGEVARSLRAFASTGAGNATPAMAMSAELGKITGNNAKLIDGLRRSNQGIDSLRSLTVAISTQRILDAIDSTNAPTPGPSFQETQSAARQRYAAEILTKLDTSYPLAAIARRAAAWSQAAPDAVTPDTVSLLNDLVHKTDFELGHGKLTDVVTTNASTLLQGVNDVARRGAAIAGARRIARLHAVAGHSDILDKIATARTRNGALFGGAFDIARFSKPAFLHHFSDATPSEVEDLTKVHEKATSIADLSGSVLLNLHQAAREVVPAALRLESTQGAQLPTWAQLFGEGQMCECDDCRSLWGPAAYLVNLFEFLDKRCKPNNFGFTPLDVLIGRPDQSISGRRPDLADIKLSCANTDATLPTIDLINEILERSITVTHDTAAGLDDQLPPVTSEELAAAPLKVNAEAQIRTRTATFGLGLPFDRHVAAARLYLGQVRSSYEDVLASSGPVSGLQAALAAERLGILPVEWEILSGTTLTGQAQAVVVRSLYAFDTGEEEDDNWNARLAVATEAALRLKLTIKELTEVLDTIAVSGRWAPRDESFRARIPIGVHALKQLRDTGFNQASVPADIAAALTWAGVDLALLKDWSTRNLTLMGHSIVIDPPAATEMGNLRVFHLDASTIPGDMAPTTDDGWLRIHRFVRLRRRLGISTGDLDVAFCAASPSLAWNAAALMRLAGIRRLKDALRLDWRTASSLVADIDTRGSDALYAQLFVKSGIHIADPVVGSTLAIDFKLTDHLIALATAFSTTVDDLAALIKDRDLDVLTLSSVSQLHRDVVVSKAIGVAPAGLKQLEDVAGLSAATNDPDITLQLIELGKSISAGPGVDAAAQFASATIPPQTNAGYMALLAQVKANLDKLSTAALTATAGGTEPATDATALLKQQQASVRGSVAQALGFDSDVLSMLLEADHFTLDASEADLKPFLPGGDPAAALSLLTALGRIYITIAGFKLTVPEIRALLPSDLFAILGAPRNEGRCNDIWLSLVHYTALRSMRPDHVDELLTAMAAVGAAQGPNWQLNVAVAAAAFFAIGTDVVGPHVVGQVARSPEPSKQPLVFLEALATSLEVARRTQCSYQTLANLVMPADAGFVPLPAAKQAALSELIRGVQGRYQLDAWLGLSKQLNDVLREQWRDALVEYRTAAIAPTENALFDQLLIDPQINSFLQTSRIAHAISTVQIFVQRCCLGLEATPTGNIQSFVHPDQISPEWHDVIGSFRMWQANMEILARPEWFMEGELRDDQTPAFRDLISFLRQNDPTDQNLNQALSVYLEALSEVGNLELCGSYLQEDFSADEAFRFKGVLHVFGRTRSGLQKKYFYRRLNRYSASEEWTPWEPVKVDIQGIERDRPGGQTNPLIKPVPGVHLLPVVWRRRLHVFWPTFVRKTESNKTQPAFNMTSGKSNAVPPAEYWEIKMCWSRYENGAWTSKEQSSDYHETYQYGDGSQEAFLPDPDSIVLKAKVTDDTLTIGCVRQGKQFATFSFGAFRTDAAVTQASGWWQAALDIPYGLNGAAYQKRLGNQLQFEVYSGQIDQNGNPITYNLLGKTASFSILPLNQGYGSYRAAPFFIAEGNTSYFASTQPNTFATDVYIEVDKTIPQIDGPPKTVVEYDLDGTEDVESLAATIQPFFHPFVDTYATMVNRYGYERLFAEDMQRLSWAGPKSFAARYTPDPRFVTNPTLVESVDFAAGTPYGVYNNELFLYFHLQLSDLLVQNKQFKGATDVLKRIFDPLGREVDPSNSWNFVPFRDDKSVGLEALIAALSAPPTDPNRQALVAQIEASRLYPYQPYRIARMRPNALKRHAFIKSANAWLKWGEDLHRRYTPESLTQAFQTYLVAATMLGSKPQVLPARNPVPSKSYAELRGRFDELGDVLLTVEENLPALADVGSPVAPSAGYAAMVRMSSIGYFCVPPDERLLALWDTVEDRLQKLRNGMTIDGVRRQPSLYGEPIDPSVLVAAAAAGVNPQSAVDAAIGADRPLHRFQSRLRIARDLIDQLIQITASLASTLEKKDAETLQRMRAQHESEMLALDANIKQLAIDELDLNIEALGVQREISMVAWNHAREMLGIADLDPPQTDDDGTVSGTGQTVAKRELKFVENTTVDIPISFDPSVGNFVAPTRLDETGKVLAEESEEIVRSFEAATVTASASILEGLGGILALIPSFEGAVKPLGMGAGITFGGINLGGALAATARAMNAGSVALGFMAMSAARKSGFINKERDLVEKLNTAAVTALHIDRLRIASLKRRKSLLAEQSNQQQLREKTKAVEDFLATKFTSVDFYERTEARLVDLQSQIWGMALSAVEQARSAFRYDHQLAPPDLPSKAWDPTLRGLLSGEPLKLALSQLENAYLAETRQDLELTRNFSLRLINPFALAALRETGQCEFSLSEALFDMDNPGHYFRRIYAVALSIPSVTGPYAPVSATLTQNSSRIRIKPESNPTAYPDRGDSDDRFKSITLPIQQIIVTSSGREDSGLFGSKQEDIYRPFEGTGTVSTWSLTLPMAFPQFDYRTISDVVIHLRYTARFDGGMIEAANRSIAAQLNSIKTLGGDGVFRLYSVRHDRVDDWFRFVNGPAGSGLTFPIDRDSIPQPLKSVAKIVRTGCVLVWVPKTGKANVAAGVPVTITGDDAGPWTIAAARPATDGPWADAYLFAKFEISSPTNP